MNSNWDTVGLLLAIGLPLGVFVWAVCWPPHRPPRKPRDKKVNRDER
jgi:hypothetical protein